MNSLWQYDAAILIICALSVYCFSYIVTEFILVKTESPGGFFDRFPNMPAWVAGLVTVAAVSVLYIS